MLVTLSGGVPGKHPCGHVFSLLVDRLPTCPVEGAGPGVSTQSDVCDAVSDEGGPFLLSAVGGPAVAARYSHSFRHTCARLPFRLPWPAVTV